METVPSARRWGLATLCSYCQLASYFRLVWKGQSSHEGLRCLVEIGRNLRENVKRDERVKDVKCYASLEIPLESENNVWMNKQDEGIAQV
jgi:hypothetical protein